MIEDTEDLMDLAAFMSNKYDEDNRQLVKNYLGEGNDEQGKDVQAALDMMLKTLLSEDVSDIRMDSDKAIAQNTKRLERLSGQIAAFDRLAEKHHYFETLNSRQFADTKKWDDEMYRDEALKKLDFLRTTANYYLIRKEIINDPIYKTHYNDELSMDFTATQDQGEQELAKKLLKAYVISGDLMKKNKSEKLLRNRRIPAFSDEALGKKYLSEIDTNADKEWMHKQYHNAYSNEYSKEVVNKHTNEFMAVKEETTDQEIEKLIDGFIEKEKIWKIVNKGEYSDDTEYYELNKNKEFGKYVTKKHGDPKLMYEDNIRKMWQTDRKISQYEQALSRIRSNNSIPEGKKALLISKTEGVISGMKQEYDLVKQINDEECPIFKRTFGSGGVPEKWSDDDIIYIQTHMGSAWVERDDANMDAVPVSAEFTMNRKEVPKLEVKEYISSKLKKTEYQLPMSKAISDKMKLSFKTWGKYGRTPLKMYGLLKRLEQSKEQIIDEINAVNTILSENDVKYREELNKHLDILNAEQKQAEREITTVSDAINGMCEREDYKAGDEEAKLFDKAELCYAFTDVLINTDEEKIDVEKEWSKDTREMARKLVMVKGLREEYGQLLHGILLAINELEKENVEGADRDELMKLVDRLFEIGDEDYQKAEMPEAITEIGYYFLRHDFSFAVRTDALYSMSKHAGKELSDEEKKGISNYITSSFALNYYLRTGKNIFDDNKEADGKYKEAFEKQKTVLESIITKYSIKQDIPAYRGTDDRYLMLWFESFGIEVKKRGENYIDHDDLDERFDEIKQQIVGKTYVDKGFTSTTTEKSYAEKWIRQYVRRRLEDALIYEHDMDTDEYTETGNYYKNLLDDITDDSALPGQHVIHIEMPKGTKAAMIDKMGKTSGSQQEILVNHGSIWKVKDIKKGAHKGQYHIYVKIINEEGLPKQQ
jgi:hypothetical protein